MELEAFRVLELFHNTSAILMQDLSADGKYKSAAPHLEIIAAGAISDFNLPAIAKKYKLSMSKNISPDRSGFTSGFPDCDFWHFLDLRSKPTGNAVHGLRQDWLDKYPSLQKWDGTATSTETLHCEVNFSALGTQR